MIDFSKKPLFLAPMAGFSDPPFRNVVKKFGADITISEMISSNALVYESSKTLHMLERAELENPYIVQIAGGDKEVLKKAVQMLNEMDFVDGIDFNCGCPVNKVVKQCAG
ncbi:TPA: tRNA-dihydrouridine synthase family protein, partial [Campylobacter jejuni]|nr:tRNA-dihydrouridine synthase family protein [Campylobacter jejuni]